MASESSVHVLRGDWWLAMDPSNAGRVERWFDAVAPQAVVAPVPGIIQQVMPGQYGVAWYWHSFHRECSYAPGQRLLLRFGAVDYFAEVWVNGKRVGSFEGGETPFTFDVTNLVKAESENLLAVRVVNPVEEPIDGFVLDQVPHRNKVMRYKAGSSFNTGGILYPVELIAAPAIRIADLFVRPEHGTGHVMVTITIHNDTGVSAPARLRSLVAYAAGSEIVFHSSESEAECGVGESKHERAFTVTQPNAWGLDDPFLYRLSVTLEAPEQDPHVKSVRFGFRQFAIVDGYFRLNGKRIFLKCSHTGNHVPIGQQVAVVPDHVRRDLINAKACGFNAIRMIAGVAWPAQLDFCDEIGLLIIESCLAGWLLARGTYDSRYTPPPLPYSPVIDERYDHSVTQMILRDRNHPCVVAWELLNETEDGPIFERARAFLPRARAIDPTRLLMLNSGRFDNRFDIGSCCNPGSDEWEHVWGGEGPDAPRRGPGLKYPSQDGAGDFHFYPGVPHTGEARDYLRNLGRDTKPVFLSEYGVGSLFNVISEWLHFQEAGARPDLEDAALVRGQSEMLAADLQRLGLGGVYPFPEGLLRESERLNARQRTSGFNLVRSNPKLCGFNLTGLLDHGMSGEGLWTFWREWKPEMFDAVSDGWSPLRWCLFVDPLHVWAGRKVTVEAVLASEDTLPPGDYPARFRVFGPTGLVWEKAATLTIPDPPQLAVPVMRASFTVKGPSGRYVLAAELERGGAPTGGSLEFFVSNPAEWPGLSGRATVWGIGKAEEAWMTGKGLRCRQLSTRAAPSGELILVGLPADAKDPERWRLLRGKIRQGASAIFLSAALFKDNPEALRCLPNIKNGVCKTVIDHLYHKECVANRHPAFDGLPGPGVMDMDYWGPVLPHEVFFDMDTPHETICAAFNTGYFALPGGYGASLLIARYKAGKGSFIVSTPAILPNLGRHPAADRLLVNLIRDSQRWLRS